MIIRIYVKTFLIAAFMVCSASAELRISEFQAENLSTLEDEELNSPDWVEIENTGDSQVDLAGYFLTDNRKKLDKWEFPSGIKVKAGEQVVVFASEKNQHTALTIFQQSDPIKPTHTNFKLGFKGEYLALVEPDGETVIHEYADEYPRQIGNVSYGIDSAGELGYFKEPTPGEANGQSVPIGPFITDVVNVTGPPDVATDNEVIITAEVIQNEFPVAKVDLIYRFMFGSESKTNMKDDGEAPDETADDGVYTAAIALSSIFGPQVDSGEMIRWRVEAEDDQGNEQRLPLFHDEENADEYFGTVAQDASLESTKLPVIHWFIESPNAANNDRGTKASVSYLGEFYDNIHVDIHGQSTRGFPKKSWDFDFNTGHRFKYAEEEARVKDFNLLTNWADKAKVRNTMAYEMFSIGGVRGHFAFSVRVQQNGEFLGTWDMVEDGDELFLDRKGLSKDGALYKMYNRLDSIGSSDPFSQNGGEKKTRRFEDKDDLQALIDGISKGSTSEKIDYIYDNVDIPSMVNFLVMNSTINNTDFGHKNYYVYRDTEGTGEWTELPWDVDLSLGRRWISSHNYFYDPIQTTSNDIEGHIHGNRLAGLFMSNRGLNAMVYRRLRTMYDYFYGPPGGAPKSDYLMRRMDELVEAMDPEGIVSDADLDYEKGLPDMERKFNESNGWDNKDTMREGVQRMRDEYIPGRREYVYGLSKLPDAQKPYAQFKLKVDTVEFRPSSGNQKEEYFVLKNETGELIDLSNFKITGAVEHTIKPGTILDSGTIFAPDQGSLYVVRDAQAFRARSESPTGGERNFVQGNYSGQLSARGDTIQIMDPDGNLVYETSYEGDPSDAQASLRISEVMYRPESPEEGSLYKSKDFEYIELTNISDAPLELTGTTFTDGVRFAFADGTMLAPGAVALIVSNQGAFESRYGAGMTILGEFEGNLSNGGDRLVLRDSMDENVLAFSYDEEWQPQADQEGHSLEVASISQEVALWDVTDGWNASAAAGGTPGSLDGGPVDPPSGMTYATWKSSHFNAADASDEAISGPEADANGDGMVNLLSYAFNASPYETAALPELAVAPESISLSFIQHASSDDLIYRVEVSEDLKVWSTAGEMDGDPAPGAGNTQRVTIKAAPPAGTRANYIRLAVVLKP